MNKTTKLLRIPIWFLQIFTEAKSFESNPIIGNQLLNRLGLHLFRLVLAHSLTAIRRFILSWGIPAGYRQQFKDRGYIVIEEALSKEHFESVQKEANQPWPEVRYFEQGDTRTEFVFLDTARQQALPASQKLAENRSLKKLMRYVAACGLTPWMDFLKVVNRGGAREGDPQKYFHSDTFHPTMKAWLFLEDVTAEKGPFEYICGSNKLNWQRIKWEYQQSIGVREEGAKYARRGSLRVDLDRATQMGYGPVISFDVKENSMVIADTFGFHRRGEAAANTTRLSVAFSNRINPFLLLPVPGFKLFDRIAERLVNRHYEAMTKLRD